MKQRSPISMHALLPILLWLSVPTAASDDVMFTPSERDIILSHGPWPPDIKADASNRVSGNANAVALGKRLFFEPRLSSSKRISCATCHIESKAFSDGLRRARGTTSLDRNTPSVWNVRFNRWFGWAGATDTLWGASIRPILAKQEMAASADHVAGLISSDRGFASLFERTFNVKPQTLDHADLLVDVGKALAAYQETLVTKKTSFDRFRDALANRDVEAMERYSKSAQRGLKLFVGKGQCSVCHFGPTFSNGEFGDAGIGFFTGPGKVDKGRYGGIQIFRQSPYTHIGPHSDDQKGKEAVLSRHVALQHSNWGEFKVPSLRNAALTAPYMHNGSLATLRNVVIHYSEIDEERLHSDGVAILKPLNLTSGETGDLVAFLVSLTNRD
jgi:cytochrome c peroxidase